MRETHMLPSHANGAHTPTETAEKRNLRQGNKPAYNDAIGAKVCGLIADGKSLRDIERIEGMPSARAILDWLSRGDTGNPLYQRFSRQYTRAREASGDLGYAEIVEIERRMLLPKVIPNPAYDAQKAAQDKAYSVPEEIGNPDYIDPQTGRVLIDSIKWRVSKLKPKVYGDRLEVQHGGKVEHEHTHRAEAPDWIKAKLPPTPAPEPEPVTIEVQPSGPVETH